MKEQQCKKCKGTMRVISTMNSGNAKYETWQCSGCNDKKTVCSGVNR